ncbi:hypothetical protein QBC46DRAFT_423423 [Diplogelasinospora grovesii]|uniref:Hydantoinase n=1 Tax=Diplogelasinospora grovesii TaxID=303347 RepID=A0AAN6MXB3_9PEZI|nr:hypothetical protein QBC46DRAFT_423423 [Diplogelasinospora grovesii]
MVVPYGLSNGRSYVIGIDVGGTNTDAVALLSESGHVTGSDRVVAWHKTRTTADIQKGVESVIEEVVRKANIPSNRVSSLRIGTTQFVNAVLERDAGKLDKVAVIRLCGRYSRGSPPFADFPPGLRKLVEGHSAFVNGGYEVDGRAISRLDYIELRKQADIIKSRNIKSVVVIGIYSPSNPDQELEAAGVLFSELGPTVDIFCSHKIGRLGFLERENASILNASLRRFARHVIASYAIAARRLGNCSLYITLNDGTLSRASEASECPVKCFLSGPTNSARGAAFLAEVGGKLAQDDSEVLVVDIGGTTTDVCALTKSGFPRQSAAFAKIAGVRTNFAIPDVHSIALGGGSLVREQEGRTTVGPDSVAFRLEEEAIYFGGQTLTATDLVLSNPSTQNIPDRMKTAGLAEINRAVGEAIDLVKTKQGDAIVILVGGGVIILENGIPGVDRLLRPEHYEVANAVGAAIGKISGLVDTIAVPGSKSVDVQIEEAKRLAIDRCIAAGGTRETAEVVEVDVVPISYVTNGATRLMVRAVSELEEHDGPGVLLLNGGEVREARSSEPTVTATSTCQLGADGASKGSSSQQATQVVDLETYRPDIREDLWYISETDLQFLQDGTGVLGVGSCGEPYPTYIACQQELRKGEAITVRRQGSIGDLEIVLVGGFMGSPTVYLERIPGEEEVISAISAVARAAGLSSFDAIIPNEIGGMNAFEALLAASRLGKSTLDTDCVARAYPYLWQTVRCLDGVPVTPAAVGDGSGNAKILETSSDAFQAEDVLRAACTDLGSLVGICINPIRGSEARTLPPNSFSYAWTIGRSIALSRSRKRDPARDLVAEHNGVLLFSGKIVSVVRHVSKGFTRGSATVAPLVDASNQDDAPFPEAGSLFVEFENENLCAVQKEPRGEDKVLAVCPDLITFLDRANGAPLGVSDYKYGLRVNVIALRAPPIWGTERGLKMGGPKAFGLNVEYSPVTTGEYAPPKSVWELFS